jgi:hypothetical protein
LADTNISRTILSASSRLKFLVCGTGWIVESNYGGDGKPLRHFEGSGEEIKLGLDH